MAAKRQTNNSVSSLVEQNEVLNIICEDKDKDKDKKLKKISKKKKVDSVVPEKRQKLVQRKPAETMSRQEDEEDRFEEDQNQWRYEDMPPHLAPYMVPGHFGMQMGFPLPYPGFGQESEASEHNISEEEEMESVQSEEVQEEGSVEKEPIVIPEVKIKGVFADVIKQQLTQVKEADKVAPKLSAEIAMVLDNYLKDSVYPSELEKLSKQYPRIENVSAMKVPRLDGEIYQVLDHRIRNMDQSFQAIQKGVLAAIGALAPLLQLAAQRGDTDTEFDACGRDLCNSIQLLSFAMNGISARRRELIRPYLAPIYAQVLTKGHETTPDWLFGGNLVETTKKVEVSKRISDKILKKKPQQQQQNPRQQRPQGTRQFRPQARQSSYGQLRGYAPQQGYRFKNPQFYNPYHYQQQQAGFQPDYQQQARFQYSQQYQQPQQMQQQFPKKGNQPQK